MKKQTLSVVGLCLLTGLIAASAYAQPGRVKAKIPFEFKVGGKTYPAGEYCLTVVPHRVDIQDAKGKKIAMFLANEISEGSAGENGRIIFQCYSEHCFLSEVWSPDYEHGALVSSRPEVNRPKQESGKIIAVLGEKFQK